MEDLRLKCYKTAVATCKLIMDMDEGSLTELIRCCDRAVDLEESSEAPSSQAAQTVFDAVYDTEFHPLNGLGNTFSQPRFWPAVPIAIPFVIVGTVLGGPYVLTREYMRRNRIWKMYQCKSLRLEEWIIYADSDKVSSFIDAMFRLLSELHCVLGVESVRETSLSAKELSCAGSMFPNSINEQLTTKTVRLEKWSEKIIEDPV